MTLRRRSPRPIAGALEPMRGSWQPATPLGAGADRLGSRSGVSGRRSSASTGAYIVERTKLVSLKAGVLTVRCSEAVVADTLGARIGARS